MVRGKFTMLRHWPVLTCNLFSPLVRQKPSWRPWRRITRLRGSRQTAVPGLARIALERR